MTLDTDDLLERAERDPASVDPEGVVRAFHEGDLAPTEAGTVLETLVETADRDPLQEVASLLADDPDLRDAAAAVVYQIARERPNAAEPLVPALVDCIEDDTVLTSAQVLRLLSVVIPAYPRAFHSSIDTLLTRLESTGRDGRELIATALYHLSEDDPGAFLDHVMSLQTQLARLGGDTNDAVGQEHRSHGAIARQIEKEQLFHDRIRVLLVQTLANVADTCPDPASVIDIDVVLDLADPDQYPELRSGALALLGSVADDEPTVLRDQIPTLAAYACDENERVAGQAAWVLSILAETYPDAVATAIRPQVDAVLDLLTATDPSARGAAVGLVAYLAETCPGDVRPATPRIVDLLEDDHEFVRGGAVLALESLGTERALAELRRVSDSDPDPDVRRTAAAAVRTIEGE